MYDKISTLGESDISTMWSEVHGNEQVSMTDRRAKWPADELVKFDNIGFLSKEQMLR